MFYLSGNRKGNLLGVVDTDDNIEEFYTKEYLLSTGLEVIRLNKELELGFKCKTKCFEFTLIELNKILGWRLKALDDVDTFGNKSHYLGYPVISFEECFKYSNLQCIDLKGMDTSQVLSMSHMFEHCDRLVSLDLSNFDTSRLIIMGYMFSACRSLTSLDLSNFDTSNVTNMSHMFYACEKLTSLNLSSFDTSEVVNMWNMFYGCEKLTSLNLSNFDTHKVTNMWSMFDACKSLTFLDLSNFDISNVTNIEYMFRDCKKLRLVYVSSSELLDELPPNITVIVPKSSGIKYDKLFKHKKDIAKYLLMLSSCKVAYEVE